MADLEARKLVTYEQYSQTFDECAMRRYDTLRHRFRTIHLVFLTINLFLVSLATILQAWDTGEASTSDNPVEWQDVITLVAGSSAVIVRGIEQTIGLVKAEAECSTAHSDLAYFLTTRRNMPAYIHTRILQTNTLCFAKPRKCSEK